MIDGFTDYPIALGRQTYQDSVFRSWAAGNITADPTNAAHLAVVWSDMRNSALPAPTDPYARRRTRTSSSASRSTRPYLVGAGRARAGQRPVHAVGRLRCGRPAADRYVRPRYDPANHRYGYRLATETGAGTLAFAGRVTTVRSDPTRDNRWFAATLNPAFPFATTFLGDYSNIAGVPGIAGGVVAYWTDLRERACFAGTCGHGQDAYFAAAP